MKIKSVVLMVVLAWACTAAGAEEVVRFQDGRYLKVEGHEVQGEAVKLSLPNRSVMVFPLDRVEIITRGRVVVFPSSWQVVAQEGTIQAVAETRDREKRG